LGGGLHPLTHPPLVFLHVVSDVVRGAPPPRLALPVSVCFCRKVTLTSKWDSHNATHLALHQLPSLSPTANCALIVFLQRATKGLRWKAHAALVQQVHHLWRVLGMIWMIWIPL